MPLTTYGSGTKRVPLRAARSMLRPGDGSFDSLTRRAKRSRQFPTAMSIVSPKMR